MVRMYRVNHIYLFGFYQIIKKNQTMLKNEVYLKNERQLEIGKIMAICIS